MEKKIFMISQISEENTKSRKYADSIFECVSYGLGGLQEFIKNGDRIYNDVRVDYEECREKVSQMKNILEDTYILERHDINNNSSNLLEDLYNKLTKDYFGYIVLVDTDKEFNNHGEPPYTNANVFFEYGVVRAKGKKIALIKQHSTRLPWDISIINATNIPTEILEFIKNELISVDNGNQIFNLISRADKSLRIKMYNFAATILNKLVNPPENEASFSDVLDKKELKEAGFENTRQMLDKITTLFNTLNSNNFFSKSKHIDTEKGAFEALTEAVKEAKKSIRTTRFANQSIVKTLSEGGKSHTQEFMEALYNATLNNPNLLCYRIVCNNHADKWWDIYQTLVNSNTNMNIFVCKQQYDIHFEIVVIDERITFLHFYQTSSNEHNGSGEQSSGTYVRKIQSTLRIIDENVGKEFAKIFDRLHHRDETSMSRRLLQIGGNPENIEDDFEGMMLKLDNRNNPDVDAKDLLVNKWREYKKIYDNQSRSNSNYLDKQDYINFTCGLYRRHINGMKGCGIHYDKELEDAYNNIMKEHNTIEN